MNLQAFLEYIHIDTYLLDSIFISLYLILSMLYIGSRKAFIPLMLSFTIIIPLYIVMYYEATFSSADNMWRFYFLLTILDFLAFSVITSAWVNLKGYSGLVIKSCSAMLMLTSFLSLVETYYNISSNTLSDIIYKVVTPLSHILIIANLCKKGAVCGNGLYNSSSSRDGFGNKSSQDNNKGVP